MRQAGRPRSLATTPSPLVAWPHMANQIMSYTELCQRESGMHLQQSTPSGRLTENGKFHKAAQDYKQNLRKPELVRVYEKLYKGIWSFNGLFELVDSWQESDGTRQVFRFKLSLTQDQADTGSALSKTAEGSRMIPSEVKRQVYERDQGKCSLCGSNNELHFDHILPYSKGGTSNLAANIQLLCARHNLQKSDRIE